MENWLTGSRETAMGSSTDAALIVFAWGNESRGDDAIGPLLARRLAELNRPGLVVIEDHQLNIEHVMDFEGRTPLVFVDASVGIDSGFRVSRIGPSADGNFSTHAISPQALLNVYQESVGAELPEAYLLEIAGSRFDLGEHLSAAATEALESAWEFLETTFRRPASHWGAVLLEVSQGPLPHAGLQVVELQ